ASNGLHPVCAANLPFQPFTLLLGAIAFGDFLAKNLIGMFEFRRSALYVEFQFVVGSLESLFKTFVFGDISHMEQQCRLANIHNAARSNGDWNRSTVRGEAEAFKFSWTVGFKRYDPCTISRRHKFARVFSDDLFAGQSMKCLGGRIAVQNSASHVFNKN